ncbi:MAG: hypothetical protein J6D16_05965 [Clostridia bacterium]|nr:hypothetical protein [Clostridia bacterium]
MTIMEAIGRVDSVKTNGYGQEEKVAWLSALDGIVKTELLIPYGDTTSFDGYRADTPGDTILLIPPPYDEIYLRYLEMQIDYATGDYDRYNNALALYNTLYSAFVRWYHRTHTAPKKNLKFY